MTHKTLIIIILILSAAASGCTSKPTTYVHDNNPDEYIELYADQGYVVVQESGFCGTWYIHNSTLHLYFDDALLYILQPDSKGYIDPDGDLWSRA